MASGSWAASPASDNAADPAYSAGWSTGTNGGTGFGAWSMAPVGSPPQFSYFIGSSASNGAAPPSGNIDSAGKSWGLANAIADGCRASRQLTGGALAVGQHVLVDMDNGAAGGLVEFALRSGVNDRFEWLVDGTNTDTYLFANRQSPTLVTQVNTAIPLTANGLHLDFTLTGADTFAVDATPAGGTVHHFTGTLEGTTGTGIDTLEFLNFDAGTSPSHDLFFNNVAVTPEPAGLGLLALGGLLLVRRRRV
jgi:MYXO-CTERM domain-containing protein